MATARSSMNSLMTMRTSSRSSILHAPFADRPRFDGTEDDVFNEEPDDNDRQQTSEHVGDLELVLVLVDEPSQSTRSRRHAEHKLGGDERPPCERPTDFEPCENTWKRRRNEDARDVRRPGKSIVSANHAKRIRYRKESRMRVERDSPQHRMDDDEDDAAIAQAEPDQCERQQCD